MSSQWKWIRMPLLFGATGAIGCVLAAIAGEVFLHLTRIMPQEMPPRPVDVVLCIDVSGSMKGQPLVQVKEAMDNVIKELRAPDRLAIVSFHSVANVEIPFTSDTARLMAVTQKLQDQGSTNMKDGLDKSGALHVLDGQRIPAVLLFTDGAPDSTWSAVAAGKRLRRNNIGLVAIAAGQADVHTLAKITGDPAKVFDARNTSNLFETFRQAMKSLRDSHQFMEGDAETGYSVTRRYVRSGGWTVIITLGALLAIIMVQNKRLGNILMPVKELFNILWITALVGCAAGGTGQFIYESGMTYIGTIEFVVRCLFWGIVILGAISLFTDQKKTIGVFILVLGGVSIFFSDAFFLYASYIFRCISWSIWVGLITIFASLLIPNFDKKNAIRVGLIGGIVAAICFALLDHQFGSIIGRLAGAGILGVAIGILVGLYIEKHGADAIVVTGKDGETYRIVPGEEAVTVGTRDGAGGLTIQADRNGQITVKSKENSASVKETGLQLGDYSISRDIGLKKK